MSVSIASIIASHQAQICFVTNGNASELIRSMVEQLESLSDVARDLLLEKFQYVFEVLEESNNIRKANVS